MRWGHDFTSLLGGLVAIFCALSFLGYAAAVSWASVRQARAARSFGDPKVFAPLVSYDATGRRAVKAVLLVLAMVFAFAALARPKFGSGTRIVPATNLDVIVVRHHAVAYRPSEGRSGAPHQRPARRAIRGSGFRG